MAAGLRVTVSFGNDAGALGAVCEGAGFGEASGAKTGMAEVMGEMLMRIASADFIGESVAQH